MQPRMKNPVMVIPEAQKAMYALHAATKIAVYRRDQRFGTDGSASQPDQWLQRVC